VLKEGYSIAGKIVKGSLCFFREKGREGREEGRGKREERAEGRKYNE
jgi:hypothetical protein